MVASVCLRPQLPYLDLTSGEVRERSASPVLDGHQVLVSDVSWSSRL